MRIIIATIEVIGLAAVCLGLWSIWEPLGMIGAGIILITVAQAMERTET